NRIAGKGQRTLAIAVKEVTEAHSQLKFEDVQEGMCILGLVGIIDPPSGEATSAIQKCQTAGIRVKMITGDHVLTARAVGFEMGIGDGITALSGHDLNNLKDDEIQRLVKEVDVYARVSPEHKMRLVRAIQANGDVVAI
ncbi:MAG: HAD family hydrolase, partial [Thermodesulfovibrionales bacterium]|nr:HAD family hydrolase [Thermodesulfovibrionales bacterium]